MLGVMKLSAIWMLLIFWPSAAYGAAHGGGGEDIGEPVLLVVFTALVVCAVLLGRVFEQSLGQAAVLASLLFGSLIETFSKAYGCSVGGWLDQQQFINVFAAAGVQLLLFQSGLESRISTYLGLGWRPFGVAVIGCITPAAAAYAVVGFFDPNANYICKLFVAAAVTATSVGVTVLVLRFLGAEKSRAAQTIIGAAVVDDVLGLFSLSLVIALVAAADNGGNVEFGTVVYSVLAQILFIGVILAFGGIVSHLVFLFMKSWVGRDGVLLGGLIMCFAGGALAQVVGLEPIVGAFFAGLVVEDKHHDLFEVTFSGPDGHKQSSWLEAGVGLLSLLGTTIFFVSVGAKLDLALFLRWDVAAFTLVLSATAIVGKVFSGIAAHKGDRLAVGVGMIPRAEVGLVFAQVAAAITVQGAALITPETGSALIGMVAVTTFIAPPLMRLVIKKT